MTGPFLFSIGLLQKGFRIRPCYWTFYTKTGFKSLGLKVYAKKLSP